MKAKPLPEIAPCPRPGCKHTPALQIRMKRTRDEIKADAQHFNRTHPNAEPIPEDDATVDAVILDLEMKLLNPSRESGKA
jgi:hypothetical protein